MTVPNSLVVISPVVASSESALILKTWNLGNHVACRADCLKPEYGYQTDHRHPCPV